MKARAFRWNFGFRVYESTIPVFEQERYERLGMKAIILKISNFQSLITNGNLDNLWDRYQETVLSCKSILGRLFDLGLPYNMQPLWTDFSDAGPGVECQTSKFNFAMPRWHDFGNQIIVLESIDQGTIAT